MIHFILYSHENESVQQHLNNSMKHTDYWALICNLKRLWELKSVIYSLYMYEQALFVFVYRDHKPKG